MPHGEIARASDRDAASDRAAAHRLLYRILIKPQDNAITRYLYRPVSLPLTRLLVWTPITPNQISYLVAVLVAIGCWLTAHASFEHGDRSAAVVVLVAGVRRLLRRRDRAREAAVVAVRRVDRHDRRRALVDRLHGRARLALPSALRAATSALGFDPWIAAIVVGVVDLRVVHLLHLLQHHRRGRLREQPGLRRPVRGRAGHAPDSVRLAPAAPNAIVATKPLPPSLEFLATYLPYVVRRDFLVWAIALLCILHLTNVAFVLPRHRRSDDRRGDDQASPRATKPAAVGREVRSGPRGAGALNPFSRAVVWYKLDVNRRVLTAALLMGSAVPSSALADHSHHHETETAVAAGSEFSAKLGLLAASYTTMGFVGDYQAMTPALHWANGRFTASTSIGAYRLRKNGALYHGVGDLFVHGQASLVRGDTYSAGVVLALSAPTGSHRDGLGMGHVMVMPAAWASVGRGRRMLAASFGYGRATRCRPTAIAGTVAARSSIR